MFGLAPTAGRVRQAVIRTSAVVCFLAMGCACSTPDSELLRHLHENEAQFEQLRQMFQADKGLRRVDFDFTWPADTESVGVSQDRLAEYRRMFTALDLSHGIGADPWDDTLAKNKIWFFASAPGPRDSQKHYLYMTSPPEATSSDLDHRSAKQRPYRHATGNWYLYLEDLD